MNWKHYRPGKTEEQIKMHKKAVIIAFTTVGQALAGAWGVILYLLHGTLIWCIPIAIIWGILFFVYYSKSTSDGYEFRYRVKDRVLDMEAEGANSFWDWMICIFGSLNKPKKYDDKTFHRHWFFPAFKAFRHVTHVEKLDFDRIRLRGISMGGAINDIFAWIVMHEMYKSQGIWFSQALGCIESRCIESHETFGSPKSNKEGKTIGWYNYNRGDFVPKLPFWFKAPKRFMLNNEWRPVWKSHADYDWRFK